MYYTANDLPWWLSIGDTKNLTSRTTSRKKPHTLTNNEKHISPLNNFQNGTYRDWNSNHFHADNVETEDCQNWSLHHLTNPTNYSHTTAIQGGSFLTQEISGLAEFFRTSYSRIRNANTSALSLHCLGRGSNLGRGKSLPSSPNVQTGSGSLHSLLELFPISFNHCRS